VQTFVGAILAVSVAALHVDTRIEPPVVAVAAPRPDTTSSPLVYFAGRWMCVGGNPAGRTLVADVVFTPRMQDHWIESHHIDRPPGRYESTSLWSLASPPAGGLATVVYDNFGGSRRFGSRGFVDGTIVWTRDTTESDSRLETFTYRRTSDSVYWYAWHVRRTPGAAPVLGDSATCRRT